MRILLGNQTLSLLAGSETWTATLARQLKKMGHDVTCFSPSLGVISEGLEADEIPCRDSIRTRGIRPFTILLEPFEDNRYDLIIANHYEVVRFLRIQFPDVPIVSTIHGVLHMMKDPKTGKDVPAPEHPALDAKVDQFVAVSEEVQAKLRADYAIDSIVIRNFFDFDVLQAKRPISPGKPKHILFNTNYATKDDPETKVLSDVARHYGARLIAVGQNFVMAPDMARALEDADVVVGMGRSVLEGVCAGRLGIVHGRWGTGGVVNDRNIGVLRACNFSGRNSGGDFWTKERFIQEIDANYNDETIAWGREYALRDHNVAVAVEKFLIFAGKKEDAASDRQPYRRARDVA